MLPRMPVHRATHALPALEAHGLRPVHPGRSARLARQARQASPSHRVALLILTALTAVATLTTRPAAAQQVDEVPFITTPDRVTLAMLALAGVGPRDHVIDLGSGDGRIVITAARRFGASGLGVEIDPMLVERSQANARAAGVAGRALFREQDLFATDLAPASVVTLYLLPEVNLQLRPRLLALAPGTRIVSHDWDMGDWRPDQTLTLDVPEKAIGREKRSQVHLWRVPARVAGLWCGPGGQALRLAQQFQQVQGQWLQGGRSTQLWGGLDGATLHLAASTGQLRLQQHQHPAPLPAPATLAVTSSSGDVAAAPGTRFSPATGDRCPD